MSFMVLIDDPKEKYLPGQSIIGRVRCSLKEPLTVEVRVRLVGEECTHNSNPARVNRTWKTNFLETKNVLIRSGELEAGDYDIPFSVILPRCMPSSYIGKYGYVKFFIKAALESRCGQRYGSTTEFRVFSPIDLNDIANLWVAPSTHFDELIVSKLLCISKVVQMEVQLEKNAFIVGEVIKLAVMLTNNTRLSVSAVKVRLLVRTQAKVATPRQEFLNSYELLASEEDSVAGAFREKILYFNLKIPQNAEVPNFEKCSLFHQTALLEVVAIMKKPSKPDLKVEVDLVLGHIPICDQPMFTNNIKGKARLPDPVIIRPLLYGINSLLLPEFKFPSNQPTPAPQPQPQPPPLKTAPPKPPKKPKQNLHSQPSLCSTFEVSAPMGLFEKSTTTEERSSRRNSSSQDALKTLVRSSIGSNMSVFPHIMRTDGSFNFGNESGSSKASKQNAYAVGKCKENIERRFKLTRSRHVEENSVIENKDAESAQEISHISLNRPSRTMSTVEEHQVFSSKDNDASYASQRTNMPNLLTFPELMSMPIIVKNSEPISISTNDLQSPLQPVSLTSPVSTPINDVESSVSADVVCSVTNSQQDVNSLSQCVTASLNEERTSSPDDGSVVEDLNNGSIGSPTFEEIISLINKQDEREAVSAT